MMLLFIPFIISLFFFFFPIPQKGSFFLALLGAMTVVLGVLCTGLLDISYPWIPGLGLSFSLKISPLSFVILQMASVMMVLIILCLGPQSRWIYALSFLSLGAFNGVLMAENVLLFYIFWEMAIIPVFVLLMGFPAKDLDPKIGIRFLKYNIAGGLLLLIALMTTYLQLSPSSHFNFQTIYQLSLPFHHQLYLLLALGISMAIKLPLFPFHRWQADTYAASPMMGTMMLAAILSKLGLYGIYRFIFPLCSTVLFHYLPWILLSILLGSLYAAFMTLQGDHLKKKLAYLSMSHMGLMSAGFLSGTVSGLQGGILMMVSHAVTTISLFWIVYRLAQYPSSDMSGLMKANGLISAVSLISILASLSFPLTSGFVGELLILSGLTATHPLLTMLGLIPTLISAWFLLKWYHAVFLGPYSEHLILLRKSDYVASAFILLLIFSIGLFPNLILDLTQPTMMALIKGLK